VLAAPSSKPSPSRSHAWLTASPYLVCSWSEEVDVKVTRSPGFGAVGEKRKDAFGGALTWNVGPSAFCDHTPVLSTTYIHGL